MLLVSHKKTTLFVKYWNTLKFLINFVSDFKRCCEELCRSTLECVVRERFGSKALRVFRLLLMKKMLDQKQVEDMAMLSSKEAREILYTLLADNFVNLQVNESPDVGF